MLDLRAGESHRPEFLKVNPKGLVPVLIHKGNRVIESSIINEYINDVFSAGSLSPLLPQDKAEMRQLIRRVDDELHPTVGMLSFATFLRELYARAGMDKFEKYRQSMPNRSVSEIVVRVMKEGAGGDLFSSAIERLDDILLDMNSILEGREWLVGDEFGLADISLSPYVNRLDKLHLFEVMVGDRHPEVKRWFERVKDNSHCEGAVNNWTGTDENLLMRESGEAALSRVQSILKAR